MSREPTREVLAALVALSQGGGAIAVELPPWAAWQTVIVCQQLWRNPLLAPPLRQATRAVGRNLQEAITAAVPAAGPMLEAGWAPATDIPREGA